MSVDDSASDVQIESQKAEVQSEKLEDNIVE